MTPLGDTVKIAVQLLDDVVEANNYPTEAIKEACLANRRIGLGVMGFADLLYSMEIPYDSEQALAVADKIASFINDVGHLASEELAQERGEFASWQGSTWDTVHGRKMRNSQVTTVAPTGTISIIAGCSGGIEPLFSLAFVRQVLDGKTLQELNPVFHQVLSERIADTSVIESILEHAAEQGSIRDCSAVPEDLKRVFCTARDISPEWHVRMQAAWQKHTDAAVSKTINLPSDAAVEDVEAAYLLAHELKCKGITVYRDGSRANQPMALQPIVDQLDGIGSSLSLPSRDGRVMSLPDALAHALGKYLRAKEAHGIRGLLLGTAKAESTAANGNGHAPTNEGYKLKCPDCGGELAFEEACAKCHSCGFSQC